MPFTGFGFCSSRTRGDTQSRGARALLRAQGLQPARVAWTCINSPFSSLAGEEGGGFSCARVSLWPLSERANQVANSDTDTCPFGTGTETATRFLGPIKHPVSEQQLSVNAIWARRGWVTAMANYRATRRPPDPGRVLTPWLYDVVSEGWLFNEGDEGMPTLSFL